MVIQDLNRTLEGANRRLILMDIMYNSSIKSAPLIIFCHGYKGFKDSLEIPIVGNYVVVPRPRNWILNIRF